MTQLVISVVWLSQTTTPKWQEFATWSLYAQWIVIGDCFFLCLLREVIAKRKFAIGALTVVAVCNASVLVVELASQYALSGPYSTQIDFWRVARLMLASTIVCLLLIRFFVLLDTLNERSQAEAQARIQALQMRIQPHFLFNSLTTISELVATQPDSAEKAIGSLSMLFRAGLENERKRHTLESEINLCQRYSELERWRYEDRLTITWQCGVNDPSAWGVPKLILQPLIENAILHGVESDGTINITVDIRESARHLSLMIENGKGESTMLHKGHGIGLANIRERLFVLYDDQQHVKVVDKDQKYSVIIRFPKQALS
ncbi:two-component system sensor histidine kinase AlgZ [Arenicella xantha]|uniref:Two-component system sensor histidine kinase AlgZ n=1 Tax=Arenicella xantha TaxID=644221 RepID=A0A395JLY3_9GAMM|nr:two-component system sensor histidine kinase AlgZ [Arenicella xantha]